MLEEYKGPEPYKMAKTLSKSGDLVAVYPPHAGLSGDVNCAVSVWRVGPYSTPVGKPKFLLYYGDDRDTDSFSAVEHGQEILACVKEIASRWCGQKSIQGGNR